MLYSTIGRFSFVSHVFFVESPLCLQCNRTTEQSIARCRKHIFLRPKNAVFTQLVFGFAFYLCWSFPQPAGFRWNRRLSFSIMSSVLPFVKPVEQPRLLRGLNQSSLYSSRRVQPRTIVFSESIVNCESRHGVHLKVCGRRTLADFYRHGCVLNILPLNPGVSPWPRNPEESKPYQKS